MPAVAPPSIVKAAPEMNEASSLARKTTDAATSSGVPMRPKGAMARRADLPVHSPTASHSGFKKGVSTQPGQIAMARMPSGP